MEQTVPQNEKRITHNDNSGKPRLRRSPKLLRILRIAVFVSGISFAVEIIPVLITYIVLLCQSGNTFDMTSCMLYGMIGNLILLISSCLFELRIRKMIRRRNQNVLKFIQSSAITALILSAGFYLILFFATSKYMCFGGWNILLTVYLMNRLILTWAAHLIVFTLYFRSSQIKGYMGSDAYLKNSLFFSKGK